MPDSDDPDYFVNITSRTGNICNGNAGFGFILYNSGRGL